MIKPGIFISDRYEIIEKVGTGGMADVYKAKCHRLNRNVAIKVLKPEYSDDQTFVSKFRGEAQSAAGLSHPNIVNVYDVGDDGNLHYIVMELVEGITLKSFIERKGKLEIKEAVGIAIQIAQGMEAAHANHIIHRDIKPQNIIISREGKVKVTDFGIAKAASSNTITSNAMGSVHYISPEQARGGYSDEKSDIYSLGVTLYEMLIGKVPFEGDNAVSVALLHIQGEATPLRQLDPTIPPSLDKIVQKCMQKKPERRYLSASEFIQDLKRSLANPNGEFVKMAPVGVTDSPTINLTPEQVGEIREASGYTGEGNGTRNNPGGYNEMDDKNQLYEADDEDLDEDKDVDPKLEKFIIAGSITVAIVLGIVIIAIVGKGFGLFKFGSGSKGNNTQNESTLPENETTDETEQTEDTTNKTTVPDVAGKSLEEAIDLLKKAELSSRNEEKPSDVVPENYVIEQSIVAGEEVDKNTVVVLTVSTGVESNQLRDVTGLTVDQADTILKNDQELKVVHEYEYNDTIDENLVIRTSPKAGSDVKKGDTITVYVSKGKETKYVKVPDLRNYTQSQAEDILKSKGLVKGKVSTANSDNYAQGVVMDQSYSPDTEVEEGTKIDFTVSLGPKVEDVTYIYTASATMDSSPFADDMEDGVISMDIYYDNSDEVVMDAYSQTLSSSDFPKTVTLQGTQEGTATVIFYLDGEEFGSTNVRFKKVAK
ncbi:MAG TPA: Stk1 family PASTA domain-containing Ser/Thr kinase [Lachnospiraceae bacterium]|uniref:Stk1 family PASTA domain-containing Ser/Thr kinase n=1 Tax=Anaerosporobacter sp. TaxID=1872529 RepID=UPI000EDF2BD2|nr:Stk1 family PASTA domain-containing Ser/Thr kinase [Anaerosporobacter sp.]HAB59260.1 Stk1 family PASTA domain-containing Ser/Thr kinase [Lachnospiraceae bacterium]